MKLVVTADVHLHPWRLCSRDGGHDRLMDGLSVLRQSLDLANELKAVWVMAGDFKMPKTYWPQSALTGAHEILREYRHLRKLMVAGNHDAEGVGGSGLAPFRDVARVVERAEVVQYEGGVYLICAPWNADLLEVSDYVDEVPAGKRVLVAHGFLRGCMLGVEDTRLAKGTPASEYGNFDVAFFGDVHKGQWRRAGDPPRPPEWLAYVEGEKIRDAGPWRGEVYYAGSPYQQNWGERDDPPKGALIVDMKTGEVGMKVFNAPRYRHFELEEKDLALFMRRQESLVGDFVRVVYTGKPCEDLDRVKQNGELFRSFQLITRRPERIEKRADVHAGMPTKDLLGSYMVARPPVELDLNKTFEAGLRLAGGE